MAESVVVEELFPYEIVLAIKGLNNENRRKIISVLRANGKSSFSELEASIGIESSLLANHLKELVKYLMIIHVYEHDEEDRKFSYYQLSNFGIRIIRSFYESIYVKSKEVLDIQLYIRRVRESTNAFGEKQISADEKKFTSSDVSEQIEEYANLIVKSSDDGED